MRLDTVDSMVLPILPPGPPRAAISSRYSYKPFSVLTMANKLVYYLAAPTAPLYFCPGMIRTPGFLP